MQIVVPMAGIGKRFLEVGYSEPKPLIKVHNKPMIEYVVSLFKESDDFVFICNSDHLENTDLHIVLKNLKPKANIVSIKNHTLGPVHSVLQAFDNIDKNQSVVVTYCDFNMSWNYDRFKKTVESDDADGAVISYTGFHPHLYGPNKYAGVKVGKDSLIEEVREKHSFTKDKMKSWHSNGTYYFKNGALILKYFQELVDKRLAHDNGEYYVSQVYNKMVKDELKVVAYPINHFCQWGTPADLEQYLLWQSGLNVDQLTKKLPHISPSGHKKALTYWKEFNQRLNQTKL